DFFDTSVNPDYYENIDGVVRNNIIVNTTYAAPTPVVCPPPKGPGRPNRSQHVHGHEPREQRLWVVAASGPRCQRHPGADLIKFAGGLHGTITPSSELSVTDGLAIDGPGADKITVSGGDARRVFSVSGGATHLAIDGLTIAKGLASVAAGPAFGGGLLNDGASVSLSKVVFSNDEAQSSGGYARGRASANPRRGPPAAHPTHPLLQHPRRPPP